MLQIIVPATEHYDEKNDTFLRTPERTLQLEHSLVSLSKWESKWCKAFLSKESKTYEETLDYIRCMTITQNVDPKVYQNLSSKNIEEINAYIEAPMTATTFAQDLPGGNSRETVTAELIYYWMIAMNIPFECQKWHLNRLLTLVKVCNVKNAPPKKIPKGEAAKRRAALNASRRNKHNSRG